MKVPATCALGKSPGVRELLAPYVEAEAYEWEDVADAGGKNGSLPILHMLNDWSSGGSEEKVDLQWENNEWSRLLKPRNESLAEMKTPSTVEREEEVASSVSVSQNESLAEKKTASVVEREGEVGGAGSVSVCFLCDKMTHARVCCRCTVRLKMSLLDADLTSVGAGTVFYCLKCAGLVHGKHEHHEGEIICLGKKFGSIVAWVGQERRMSMFKGIQDATDKDDELGHPFYLHPPEGKRCDLCSDLMLGVEPKSRVCYCTIDCWLGAEGVAVSSGWMVALIHGDFGYKDGKLMDAFCISCMCTFHHEEEAHDGHNQLLVITDSQGCRPSIVIPPCHSLAGAWVEVQDLAADTFPKSFKNRLLRIRDGGPRCNHCKRRLKVGDDDIQSCSLACMLRIPFR